MTKPALILQQGPLGPAGVLEEWLIDCGIPIVVHRVDENGGGFPDPRSHAFVAVLGSRFSPGDTHEPAVSDGLRHLERAVERDVPVLGLCFGGQMLASVLGGTVEAAARPELGWHTIETDDPDDVPAGPWLQWHWHRFTTPPGAVEVARSPAGPQAFRHGRHLGVQFHPESTIEIAARWADTDAERLASEGIPDGRALLEQGRVHAATAARNARTLFDGFWKRARNGGETDGAS